MLENQRSKRSERHLRAEDRKRPTEDMGHGKILHRPAGRDGLEMGLIPGREETLRSWFGKSWDPDVLKISILCVIPASTLCFSSALHVRTKWISPPWLSPRRVSQVLLPEVKCYHGWLFAMQITMLWHPRLMSWVRMSLVAGPELSGSVTGLFPAWSGCQR